MSQLQQKNPQGHQIIQNLINNNGNPQQLLQQIMSNVTPEQRTNLLNQAKTYGVPNNVLSMVQNMK